MRKGGAIEAEADAVPTDPASGQPVDPPRADLRRFKTELTPTWLQLATLLGGHRPPDLSGRFRAAYVGSGHGFTPAVTAAVHPAAEVWWWDPDVRAVESARRLRDAARLANLTVHETPEPRIDQAGSFDLVVIDGVLDAVSDADRARLFEEAADALRPGGVACITYRTVVGWIEVAPVHRLVRHLVARDPRPAVESVPDVRRHLRSLRTGGAQYLTQRPVVDAWLRELLALPGTDLLQQVVDRDLRPLSHAQVEAMVRPFGWRNVGPAHASDLSGPALSEPLERIVAAAASRVLRETLTDLAIRRTHRADVFRLGAAPLTPKELDRAAGLVRLTTHPDLDSATGLLPPSVPAAVAALRAASDGAATIDDIADRPTDRAAALRDLVAAGATHPLVDSGVVPEATEASHRLTAVLSRAPIPVAHRLQVAPALGSAFAASLKLTSEQRSELGMR